MFLTGTGKQERGNLRRTRILELPIDSITPNPDQPRKKFNLVQIMELAESIKEHGILQPIGVRKVETGHQIVYGERRWRAAAVAGMETVPIVIVPEDADIRTIAMIENLHRQDLSAIEKAMAIKEMMQAEKLSMEAVGQKLGLGKTRVHQLLNILKLPEELLAEFCRANMNETHARGLLALKKFPDAQKELFQKIIDQDLAGNQALIWAENYLKKLPSKTPVSDMVSKSLNKLAKIEKRWLKITNEERERYIKELLPLKEKIDYLLGNS
ncbi:ParB/RepB/Spo0J family partition protein [Desulforamulus ruminis]|nr:ParB/RepB/Spo0J family partition protein [Desulforamulus ruminis]